MSENTKESKNAKKEAKNKRRMEYRAKSKSFFSDFKKFIMRGNIVDLAVAVVIGSAFNAIVNGLVNQIIMPLLSLLTGGIHMEDWKLVLVEEELDEAGAVLAKEVAIQWGNVLQSILNFLIIAFVIFLVLRVRTKATKRMEEFRSEEQKAEEAKKKAEEKVKADAAAAEAKRLEDREHAYYENVARQTQLLASIAERLQISEKSDS